MSDFTISIDQWVKKKKGAMPRAALAIAHAAQERLQELTPVVTGRLRAGWQVTVVDARHISITNNVEYAERINNGFVGTDSLGRHYDQGGYHMVDQTILEMPQIAAQALARMR